jgi:hypothetical protein
MSKSQNGAVGQAKETVDGRYMGNRLSMAKRGKGYDILPSFGAGRPNELVLELSAAGLYQGVQPARGHGLVVNRFREWARGGGGASKKPCTVSVTGGAAGMASSC